MFYVRCNATYVVYAVVQGDICSSDLLTFVPFICNIELLTRTPMALKAGLVDLINLLFAVSYQVL